MKTTFIKIIRTILWLTFASMIIISIFIISYSNYTQHQSTKAFSELSKSINSTSNPTIINEPTNTPNINSNINSNNTNNQILSKYSALYEQNSDLYGWIKISDTPIDFPVMYSPDEPQFYLRKDFYKNYSLIGTPFIITPSTQNTIIYGHNMQSDSMFSSLSKYKDKEYWQEHKYIQFDTLYSESTYEIFIVTNSIVYYSDDSIPEDAYLFYEHTNFDTQNNFDEYISHAKDAEFFDSEISANYQDSLITLCTCDYNAQNSRLLVIAKKIS